MYGLTATALHLIECTLKKKSNCLKAVAVLLQRLLLDKASVLYSLVITMVYKPSNLLQVKVFLEQPKKNNTIFQVECLQQAQLQHSRRPYCLALLSVLMIC